MLNSILITSSILSLLFLYLFAHFFLHKLKKEWMKSFLKLWIDFSFVYLVISICLITIPMQVYPTLFLGILLFFVLFFYVFQSISPGSFIFIPKKITDPIKLAKIREKKKWFYKSLIFFGILIFISMIVGQWYLLDDGNFEKTLNEKYMINEDGNLLVDIYEDGTYSVWFFDETHDGNYDTIRHDLNGDGITDVAYSDWLWDGNIVEMLYDGKYERNKLFVFWFGLFFVMFMYLTFKSNKAKWVTISSIVLLVFVSNIYLTTIVFGDERNGNDAIAESRRAHEWDSDWFRETEMRQRIRYDDKDYNSVRWYNDPYEEDVDLGLDGSTRNSSEKYTDARWTRYDGLHAWDPNRYQDEELDWQRYDGWIEKTPIQTPSKTNSSKTTTTTKHINPPKPTKKYEQLEKERKEAEEKFKKELDQKIANDEIKENTIDFIDNSSIDAGNMYNALTTIDRKNLTSKEQDQLDAFDKEIWWYKNMIWFNSWMIKDISNGLLNKEFQGMLNKNGIKSIELRDRITVFDAKIKNMIKKNNLKKYSSTIKSHKKASAWLKDFQKKNMKSWQSKINNYVWRKKSVAKAWKLIWWAVNVMSTYNDYNDFNKEFNDSAKAVTATATQNLVGGIVSANPVDMTVGIVSSGLSIFWFDKTAQTLWEFSAGAITKNGIKDSFTTGFDEFGGIVWIQYDNFKNSEGFVNGAKTAFVWTVTTGYTAGVAVAKPVLEIASKTVWGAMSIASTAVKAASRWARSIMNGISSWF